MLYKTNYRGGERISKKNCAIPLLLIFMLAALTNFYVFTCAGQVVEKESRDAVNLINSNMNLSYGRIDRHRSVLALFKALTANLKTRMLFTPMPRFQLLLLLRTISNYNKQCLLNISEAKLEMNGVLFSKIGHISRVTQ